VKKTMDHRFYPEGRKRVYLSPAHMDIHCGDSGYFVEVMGRQYCMGYYSKQFGLEDARVITREIYQKLKALSQKAAKQFGQSCGNGVCERALEKRMKGK